MEFGKKLASSGLKLQRTDLQVIQINMGKLCNQTCFHCHVDAGPNKTKENMNAIVTDKVLSLIRVSPQLKIVDLTGGAPEMNTNFRRIVSESRDMGLEVIVRCNLTVLFEKGQEDTAEFFAQQKVRVVASLPCYSQANVDKQRGEGVFEKSIKGLQLLNEFGYGIENSGLALDLVYNPLGAFLPPAQEKLEVDYKKLLNDNFSIRFNSLLCITNMPIKRFKYDLKKQGKEESYMQLLQDNFNEHALDNVMCRNMISISWDGQIYDCDFNQMLGMHAGNKNTNILDLDNFEKFNAGPIAIDNHCYGCTAGSGSSCGGNLV